MAHWTMRLAESQSATLSVLATAMPPFALISSTTFCAGLASLPSPRTEVPRSLTTTRAPAAAIAREKSRPMPPPPPVTTTLLPSRSFNCEASISEAGKLSVGEAQQRRPFQRAPAPAGLGPVEVVGLLYDVLRGKVELRVARHGRHLGLARALEPEEIGESLGDGSAHREQAMVPEDHRLEAAEVAHQALLLVQVDRHALVFVHADAVEVHRGLRDRQQAAVKRRNGHAGDGVGMDHAAHVRPPLVHRAVDDEAGLVDAIAGAGVLHHASVEIDLHQAGSRNFIVRHTVGIDQEMAFLARGARRNVVVHEVIHAVVMHQA